MNPNYSMTNTTNNIMINQSNINTNANCNKSSLNPSARAAPSFTPSYSSYTNNAMQPMQPVAEVNNEINEINQIINNDNMSAPITVKNRTHVHSNSPKFKASKRFYNHNKRWRSHNN